jgi:23S rRNA (uracil1939-C5)-methyltransferase
MTRRQVGLERTATVVGLGAGGDGIAEIDGERAFVPFALPGERVRFRLERRSSLGWQASLIDVLDQSPGRQAAPCPHFGRCGGCGLQHLAAAPYAEWKRGRVTEALARRGLRETSVEPTLVVAPGTRRRATFTVARSKAGSTVGFAERGSHRIVDLQVCPVSRPEIVALISSLRRIAGSILSPSERAHVHVLSGPTGLDAVFDLPAAPDLGRREALAGFAEVHDLARLSWRHGGDDPETLAQRRPVRLRFGRQEVEAPAGAFVQATVEGETAIRREVAAAVVGAGGVADLYAGLGTVALALVETRPVHAVEGDRRSVAALTEVARHLGGRLTVERRDLVRRPLAAAELDRFEAVVFDPPRIGARAVAEALAASRVMRVAAVSCNPATFARDARILIDGGYRLTRIQPIDQFLWSPHLELVAAFER